MLLDADALGAHFRGQLRLGEIDPVLHQHRVDVGIGADREGDVQRVAAVVAAGRLHVDHLVDADDARLDGLRHDGLDHLGAGARIAGRDLNLRRNDVGKLRDRNCFERDQAGKRDDDGNDDREPWPIDEDAGQHGSGLRLDLGRLHDLAGPHLLHALGDDLLACLQALGHRYARAGSGPISIRRTSTLLSPSTTSTNGPA